MWKSDGGESCLQSGLQSDTPGMAGDRRKTQRGDRRIEATQRESEGQIAEPPRRYKGTNMKDKPLTRRCVYCTPGHIMGPYLGPKYTDGMCRKAAKIENAKLDKMIAEKESVDTAPVEAGE